MTESETGGKKRDVVVTMPGSLTDLAKAIRELIGAVRDIGQLISDGAKLFDHRRSRRAAAHLNTLAFTPDGSRRYLERIAAGEGTADDLEAIGKQMAETAGAVEAAIRELHTHRDRIREDLGMAVANKLDEVIYGPAGKEMLRMTLLDIVQMGRQAKPPQDQIKASADRALAAIANINSALSDLHDLILPHRQK